jgi:gentisate 1,2-dioxygenase
MDALREDEGSPFDGILFEYVNPLNDGPVLPTMACYAQLIRPGEHTRAHRHTSSSVQFVLEGEGQTIVDGMRFDWGPGDFFMIPPWAWHEHANPSSKDAVFFVMSDRPVMDAFAFWREEAYPDDGGRQAVTGRFTPLTWA